MGSKGLEILEQTIRQAIGLARHRLYRKPVSVVAGSDRGKRGVVQSVRVGDDGRLIATVRIDRRPPKRGSHPPRLRIPVGLLDIGDEEKLTR